MTSTMDTVVAEVHLLWVLAIGTFLWLIGWRRYRLDVFRQRLFALRDELFDVAAAGEIDFNDFAYGGLRLLINSIIRFGHRVTAWRVLILCVFGPVPPEGLH